MPAAEVSGQGPARVGCLARVGSGSSLHAAAAPSAAQAALRVAAGCCRRRSALHGPHFDPVSNPLPPVLPPPHAECNPDGACRRCAVASQILIPAAALWIDAGYPETQCGSRANVTGEAQRQVGAPGWLPPLAGAANACAEVDPDFRCVACLPPTNGSTSAAASARGYYMKLASQAASVS